MRWLVVLLLSAVAAHAEGERPGEFDYWILSLSWSPNWCAMEGDARGAEQCGEDRGYGWILHGLWPQYENGWPSFCQSGFSPPSRVETAAQADLFGAGGAAWYQWRKHGSCSGMSPQDYYRLARHAYDQVVRPEVFRRLERSVRLPAQVVEEAFLKENPGWQADMLTITCRDGYIHEARLCLTRDMQVRDCGADVVRDCTLERALLEPIR
jgi:ribonuclease T2